MNESKIKYDFKNISNSRDIEKIVSQERHLEELTVFNKEKDVRINMLRTKIRDNNKVLQKYSQMKNDLNIENKDNQRLIDELQIKLNSTQKKIKRMKKANINYSNNFR